MINTTVTVVINQERCIGCGACIEVCPVDTLSLFDGKAHVTGTECFDCDHCRSACPSDAIEIQSIDLSLSRFKTFSAIDNWLPHGKYNTVDLVNLMQSRRSCRNFLEKPVELDILDDLVKIGISAPSGTNSQLWTFSILPDRKSVLAFGEKIFDFFENLRRLSEKSWLRILLKLIGQSNPAWYYKYFHQSMERRLDRWKEEGKDLLFHGAPAVIIVGSEITASCPAEDTLLATQNILLAAHSMGLGTCLVGYAIEAMKKEKQIQRFLNIPDDEKPYAVIAVGYSREKYHKVAGRKPITMRISKKEIKK